MTIVEGVFEMVDPKSDILDVIHGTILDFQRLGVIDDKVKRQFDALRFSDIESLIRFGQSAEDFKEE